MANETVLARRRRARRLLEGYSPGYLSPIEIDMDYGDAIDRWTDNRIVRRMLDAYDLSKVNTSNRRVYECEMSLLFAACGISNFEFIKRWKSHGLPFNITDSHGNTPLHYAVHRNPDPESFASIVQYLVHECGVNPNARNDTGSNALIFGLRRHRDVDARFTSYTVPPLLIKELARAGVDVNDANKVGTTALDHATGGSCHRSVELLLNLGANINFLSRKVLDYLVDDLVVINSCDYEFEWLLKTSGKLIRHVVRMNALGLYVINSKFKRLVKTAEVKGLSYNDELNFSEEHIEEFRKQCELEKKNMAMTKLDGVNSMLDLALKSEGEIMEFVYKRVFQTYSHSDKCAKDFPIYSFILNLRFQTAERRKLILLPNAMRFLITFNFPLYDVCLDNVLKYFTNKELKEFINAMRSEIGVIRACILF